MDAKKLVQRQTDEERSAAGVDALRLTIREMLKMVHTGMPGIVKSFDAGTQTAKVQPAIKRIWVDDGAVALPECVDVPVFFPGGGGFVLTFPVTAGDGCLLVFAERAIDYWWEKGGVQEPSEVRMHDLSDAFAFVGMRPKPQKISDFKTGDAELRVPFGKLLFLGGATPGPTGARPLLIADLANPSDPFTAWLTGIGAFCSAGPPPTTGMTLKVKGE